MEFSFSQNTFKKYIFLYFSLTQVCSTTHKEFCKDVERKSCHGVVAVTTGDSVRRCVNVTELHCGLVETVQYEMVTATYTVQKCHMVTGTTTDRFFSNPRL